MNDPFERALERERSARRGRRYREVWKRLAVHFRIYVIVNLVLVGVWAVETLVRDGEPRWFVEVLWGWGVGLLIHYIVVTQMTGTWWPRRDPQSGSGLADPQGHL